MEKEQIEHVTLISEKLEYICKEYLINNFEGKDKTIQYVLNITFGSFISACFNVMSKISEQNEKVEEENDKFINELLNFLEKKSYIENKTIIKKIK